MKKYIRTNVIETENSYEFMDEREYYSLDYEEIPLPENGYRAISIPEEMESEFLTVNDEYLYENLDAMDAIYLTDANPENRYLTLIFYNYSDMERARNEIEEFLEKKSKKNQGEVMTNNQHIYTFTEIYTLLKQSIQTYIDRDKIIGNLISVSPIQSNKDMSDALNIINNMYILETVEQKLLNHPIEQQEVRESKDAIANYFNTEGKQIINSLIHF